MLGKKMLSAFVAAVLAVGLAPAPAFAEGPDLKAGPAAVTAQADQVLRSGNYDYVVMEDGTAKIARYKGTAKKVTTPKTLGGRKVTVIGCVSFAGLGIENVTVSEGVKTIEREAFSGCGVKALKLPASLRTIGAWAFQACVKLKKIEFSEGLTRIEEGAFWHSGCKGAKGVKLPESLKYLGEGAFLENYYLPSIYFGSKVKNAHPNMFWGLSGSLFLASIEVAGGNKSYSSKSGVLFDKGGKKLLLYPRAKKGTSYKVPKGVSTIAPYAFSESKKLKAVTIPDTVKTIGEHAFWDSKALKTLTVPRNVKKIGKDAFSRCSNLTVRVPKATKAAENAFDGVKKVVWY